MGLPVPRPISPASAVVVSSREIQVAIAAQAEEIAAAASAAIENNTMTTIYGRLVAKYLDNNFSLGSKRASQINNISYCSNNNILVYYLRSCTGSSSMFTVGGLFSDSSVYTGMPIAALSNSDIITSWDALPLFTLAVSWRDFTCLDSRVLLQIHTARQIAIVAHAPLTAQTAIRSPLNSESEELSSSLFEGQTAGGEGAPRGKRQPAATGGLNVILLLMFLLDTSWKY